MKLAVGRFQNKQIDLYIDSESKISSPDEIEAVIVSALDCHIHMIPTKLKSTQQIASFIEHYIKTVHPGPYDNLVKDFTLTGKGDSRKIILVIMEEEILDSYKNLGKPLYFFFQFGINQNFSFNSNDESESYRFDSGILNGVVVGTTNEYESIDLGKIVIKQDQRLFQETRKKESTIKPVPVLLLLILCTLLTVLIFTLTELSGQRKLYENNQKRIKDLVTSRQNEKPTDNESSEIESLYYNIYNSIPRDYYSILSKISESVSGDISIKSLKITGNNITINGNTSNALRMIEELNSTGLFKELKPSKIYPSENYTETFSIAGVLK